MVEQGCGYRSHSQAAFYAGYAEDLRRGFPNRSAYWRTIVIFGAKRRKTEHECNFHIRTNARRVNIWENICLLHCLKAFLSFNWLTNNFLALHWRLYV